MMQREGAGTEGGAAWQARWWSPAPGVFCTSVAGYFGFAAVELLQAGFLEVHEAAPEVLVRCFHDWAGVNKYDSNARASYTRFSAPLMVHVDSIDVLFSSRLMAMAIAVANLVLGGKMHPLSERVDFERRVEHELARPRRPNTSFKG